jgi:hypothetical protein
MRPDEGGGRIKAKSLVTLAVIDERFACNFSGD